MALSSNTRFRYSSVSFPKIILRFGPMDSYTLLLTGSFLSGIAYFVSIFYSFKISSSFIALAMSLTVAYIFSSHFDSHSAIDVQRYTAGYYSDELTNWHIKEIGFWYLFRFFNDVFEVELIYFIFDFIGIAIFIVSFKMFGLRLPIAISAALLLFYFFPFVFGRHNVYRQYLAEIFVVVCTLRMASLSLNRSSFNSWVALLFLPATFHNAAIIALVNILLIPMKRRYTILVAILCLVGVSGLLQVLGDSSVDLLTQKITRERSGSGSIDAEYFYLALSLIFSAFLYFLLKDRLGKQLISWLVVLLLILTSLIYLGASIYGERLGMYILAMIYPLILVGLALRQARIMTIFLIFLSQVPLLSPTVSYLVIGQ